MTKNFNWYLWHLKCPPLPKKLHFIFGKFNAKLVQLAHLFDGSDRGTGYSDGNQPERSVDLPDSYPGTESSVIQSGPGLFRLSEQSVLLYLLSGADFAYDGLCGGK